MNNEAAPQNADGRFRNGAAGGREPPASGDDDRPDHVLRVVVEDAMIRVRPRLRKLQTEALPGRQDAGVDERRSVVDVATGGRAERIECRERRADWCDGYGMRLVIRL